MYVNSLRDRINGKLKNTALFKKDGVDYFSLFLLLNMARNFRYYI